MRKPGVGQIRGIAGSKRRRPLEQTDRLVLLTRRQDRDAKLVERIRLLRRELEDPTERRRRRRVIVALARDQAKTEVRFPDRTVERDDALERRSRLVEC